MSKIKKIRKMRGNLDDTLSLVFDICIDWYGGAGNGGS